MQKYLENRSQCRVIGDSSRTNYCATNSTSSSSSLSTYNANLCLTSISSSSTDTTFYENTLSTENLNSYPNRIFRTSTVSKKISNSTLLSTTFSTGTAKRKKKKFTKSSTSRNSEVEPIRSPEPHSRRYARQTERRASPNSIISFGMLLCCKKSFYFLIFCVPAQCESHEPYCPLFEHESIFTICHREAEMKKKLHTAAEELVDKYFEGKSMNVECN